MKGRDVESAADHLRLPAATVRVRVRPGTRLELDESEFRRVRRFDALIVVDRSRTIRTNDQQRTENDTEQGGHRATEDLHTAFLTAGVLW